MAPQSTSPPTQNPCPTIVEVWNGADMMALLRESVAGWEFREGGAGEGAVHLVIDDITRADALLGEGAHTAVLLLGGDISDPAIAATLEAGLYAHIPRDILGLWRRLLPVYLSRVARDLRDRATTVEMIDALRQRHDLFRDSVNAAKVGVWDWNMETNELVLDPNVKQLLGYADHDIRNHLDDWMRHVHPADYRMVMETALSCMEGKATRFEIEHRVRHRDGSLRWLYVRGKLREVAAGRRHVVGAMTDITPLKEAQAALLETEKRYRAVVDTQSEMICRTRRSGKITFVNSAFARFWRSQPDKLIGRNLMDLLPEERREEVRVYLNSFTAERSTQTQLAQMPGPGGARWVRWSGSAIHDEIGNLLEIQSVGRDITEQKLAREELQRSEARLRQVVDVVPHMIFAKDRDGRYLFVNKATADAYGMTVSELEGLPQRELHVDAENLARYFSDDHHVIETGERLLIPTEDFIGKDGKKRILQTTKVPFQLPDSNTTGVLGVAVDITHRLRVEAELRHERERFHSVLELIPAFVLLVDSEYGVRFANSRFREIFGDPAGRKCHELLHGSPTPCDHCRIVQSLNRGESRLSEYTSPDGRSWLIHDIHFTDSDGRPMVLEVGLDITRRVQTEQQFHETRGLLDAVVSRCPLVLFALDVQGNFTLSEGAGLEGLGLKSGDVVGRSALEVYAENPVILSHLKRALAGEEFSEVATAEPGRTYRTWYSPLTGPNGECCGVTGVALDITEWVG